MEDRRFCCRPLVGKLCHSFFVKVFCFFPSSTCYCSLLFSTKRFHTLTYFCCFLRSGFNLLSTFCCDSREMVESLLPISAVLRNAILAVNLPQLSFLRSCNPISAFQVMTARCGYAHTVVLCADGWAYAFGNGAYGQTGQGTTGKLTQPKRVHLHQQFVHNKHLRYDVRREEDCFKKSS